MPYIYQQKSQSEIEADRRATQIKEAEMLIKLAKEEEIQKRKEKKQTQENKTEAANANTLISKIFGFTAIVSIVSLLFVGIAMPSLGFITIIIPSISSLLAGVTLMVAVTSISATYLILMVLPLVFPFCWSKYQYIESKRLSIGVFPPPPLKFYYPKDFKMIFFIFIFVCSVILSALSFKNEFYVSFVVFLFFSTLFIFLAFKALKTVNIVLIYGAEDIIVSNSSSQYIGSKINKLFCELHNKINDSTFTKNGFNGIMSIFGAWCVPLFLFLLFDLFPSKDGFWAILQLFIMLLTFGSIIFIIRNTLLTSVPVFEFISALFGIRNSKFYETEDARKTISIIINLFFIICWIASFGAIVYAFILLILKEGFWNGLIFTIMIIVLIIRYIIEEGEKELLEELRERNRKKYE